MVRYPHTGTLHWKTGGIFNDDDGKFTAGTPQTKPIDCNVQPNGAGRKIDVGGDQVLYKFKVYCKLFSELIPDTAEFEYEGVKFKVLQIFPYQKHVEIWI